MWLSDESRLYIRCSRGSSPKVRFHPFATHRFYVYGSASRADADLVEKCIAMKRLRCTAANVNRRVTRKKEAVLQIGSYGGYFDVLRNVILTIISSRPGEIAWQPFGDLFFSRFSPSAGIPFCRHWLEVSPAILSRRSDKSGKLRTSGPADTAAPVIQTSSRVLRPLARLSPES